MNHQLQRALADAAWDGDHRTIATLIDDPDVDPAGQQSAALLHAAHRGHWRCVELLLPRSNALVHRSEPLYRAAKGRASGHRRCLALLAAASDTRLWEPWEWQALPDWSLRALGYMPSGPLDTASTALAFHQASARFNRA